MAKSPSTSSAFPQPGKIAMLSKIGSPAPIQTPT